MGLSLTEKAALFAARRREALGLSAPSAIAPVAAPDALDAWPASTSATTPPAQRPRRLAPRKPKTKLGRPKATDPTTPLVRAGAPAPVALTSLMPPGQKTYSDIRGDEERSLITRAQGGDKGAMQALLVAHDRFVWRCAQPMFRYVNDPDELLQVGRIGLMTAIRKFDLDRGVRLSTYAEWWIKHEVRIHIRDNEQDVSMPTNVWVAFVKAVRLGASSPEEAAAITAAKWVDKAWTALRTRSSRLDAPIGEDDGATLGEMTVDQVMRQDERTAEAEAQSRRVKLIEEALAKMPDREAFVLRRRHLFEDPEILEQVGDTLGVTRERVRQIEVQALAGLRYHLIKVVDDEDADALWGGWGDQDEPIHPRLVRGNRPTKTPPPTAPKPPIERSDRRKEAANEGRQPSAPKLKPHPVPATPPIVRRAPEEVLARRPLAPPGGRCVLQEIDP